MAIELNHTIIRAVDREKSVQFYRDVFDLETEALFDGHFLAVRINDSLTFDFAEAGDTTPVSHHYAFKVSEDEFEEIFARIKERGRRTLSICRSTVTTAAGVCTFGTVTTMA